MGLNKLFTVLGYAPYVKCVKIRIGLCNRFNKTCKINHVNIVIAYLVARTGFEPVISALRGRCPWPLDERAVIPKLCGWG